jgi:hypothetical protein
VAAFPPCSKAAWKQHRVMIRGLDLLALFDHHLLMGGKWPTRLRSNFVPF